MCECMKKFIIAACLAAAVVTSCTEERDLDSPDNTPVEIKLNAGVSGMETKAPVNTNDAIIAGFAATVTDGVYTANAWNTTASFTASTSPSTAFSFTAKQYYPVTGVPIYIKGFFPLGTVSGNTVSFSGTVGTNDVMITSQASGTKLTASPLAFTFKHLLTQLQFNFVAGTGYDATGKTVTSVVIKSQKTPLTLNLNDSTMTYAIGDVTISGNYAISAGGTLATDHPMVKSGETTTLSIATSDGTVYPDAIVSLVTLPGNAHLITLTFTPKEITATAIVTAWAPGGTGSSNLQ